MWCEINTSKTLIVACLLATENPTAEWNGQFQNTGRALTAGVYICKVSFLKARGERQEIKSFVTLIR